MVELDFWDHIFVKSQLYRYSHVNCPFGDSTDNSGFLFCPYDKFENTLCILVTFKGEEISEGNLIFISCSTNKKKINVNFLT